MQKKVACFLLPTRAASPLQRRPHARADKREHLPELMCRRIILNQEGDGARIYGTANRAVIDV
jgi:hypothetical protein